MSRRTSCVLLSAVLAVLAAAGAVATLAAPPSGTPAPMTKGTVKWFTDAVIEPVNKLLSGTGVTIDRYEGPRLDGIGIRVEPPLGVRVTDDNSPPRGNSAGGPVPPPSVTKKIVGVFDITVAFAAASGQEPWVTFTASNAEAAEGTADDSMGTLSGRTGFI